ncbi:MAG: tRNA (adenosine(37)-N6)-threonylcarbamoyltransferase complex dimerization subunit type 1 TsaB [Chloroflexota bacterium]
MTSEVDARGWLLAMDTATTTIVVAAGAANGRLLAAEAFEGRYRHSQELLPAVVRLIDGAGLRLAELGGVVVGTGPGAFTGLRVGIATAKTLAHELGCPVVGIPTSSALLAAVAGATALWLPSGPRDRVLVLAGGEPAVVPGGEPGAEIETGGRELAVDLAGRAPDAALALGREAVAGLPAALLALGAARLAAGDVDDPERLVPRYASPPRGAIGGDSEGGVAWSRDPR